MKQKEILKHNLLNNVLNNTFNVRAFSINNLLYTPSERATGIDDILCELIGMLTEYLTLMIQPCCDVYY